MPYISAETVKEIRKELKAKLKNYKLSVRTRHHSTVCVNVLEGPLSFEKPYFGVNEFYIDKHWEDFPEAKDLFNTILNTISAKEAPRVIVEDADYGSIPNYYVDISVGRWDREYKKVGA